MSGFISRGNIWDKVETLMRRESDEVWNYIFGYFLE